MAKWKCIPCGFIYNEDEGDEDQDIDPGTNFNSLPTEWNCPDCGAEKTMFEPVQDL